MSNKNIGNEVYRIETVKSGCKRFKEHRCTKRQRISTGYKNFDIALNGGFADELYIFGAPTSTGKSAFMMSIAQNIAESGISVLYFALEMSEDEYIARGVSEIMYAHKLEGTSTIAYTSSDILNSQYNEDTGDFEELEYSRYEPFVDEYSTRYGDDLYIIDSRTGGLKADRIGNIVSEYRSNHLEDQFVVVVDYLQIGGDGNISDRKSKTDAMVALFKSLSTQMKIPVICISSVGRDGYKKRVSLDSFKESGNIEYSGGVCFGWNWYGETVNPNKGDEVMLNQYKAKGHRLMELDVLKARNSERGARVRFNYNPAYNHFEEI